MFLVSEVALKWTRPAPSAGERIWHIPTHGHGWEIRTHFVAHLPSEEGTTEGFKDYFVVPVGLDFLHETVKTRFWPWFSGKSP